jgi:hypothetical protein
MDDWMPPELAKAIEYANKWMRFSPPGVREFMEEVDRISQQNEQIYQALGLRPKPWTLENDSAVSREFLARHRDLKDNPFLAGMIARAYLRLQKRTPHSRVNPRTLRDLVFAEYKTKHGQEPSAANFARGLKQAALGSLVIRGRPKKKNDEFPVEK